MLFKRIFCVFTALVLFTVCGISTLAYSLPEGQTIEAAAAMVVFLGGDKHADVCIYEKSADEVHAPAALVRLMVGAYALKQIKDKNIDMNTATGTYTLDIFNTHVAGTGVTAAGMEIGEQWTLRDLLTVSLIQTASDAVTTLATAVSGSVDAFVDGMNALAKEIGCKQTHFANVTGLDSLAQYTTPRDMYLIMRYAMQFTDFIPMISQKQYDVQPTSGGGGYTIVNRVDMMRKSSTFYYAPTQYGRTGLSSHEGWSLATVAADSGYEYLIIVMGCPSKTATGAVGSHYTDSIDLYRWAFRNFSYKQLLSESEILGSIKVRHVWGRDAVNLVPEKAFSTVVDNAIGSDEIIKKVTLNEELLTAPIKKGTVYGKVELIVNVDEKIGEINLVASEDMNANALLVVLSAIGSVLLSPWLWLVVGIALLAAGGYVVLLVIAARNGKRSRTIHKRR